MDDRSLKNRKYMYRDWLYNRRSEKTRKKKASKLGQKWTSRMVIEQLRKEEIIEKIRSDARIKDFIERYQTTLTAVMAVYLKRSWRKLRTLRLSAVQVDFAKKKAPGLMKDLASKLWKQAGMRIFILSGMERGGRSAYQW
ncbi:hypothetical protein EDB19DRAFT_1835673, partial [Suillus lakei]